MKIAISNDHTVIGLRNIIKGSVGRRDYEVIDLGISSIESCGYPIYGEKVGRAVVDGQADLGVTICGAGVGISLAASKVKRIRACMCNKPYTAKPSRVHNNSNMLAFGVRVVGSELAKMIIEAWLDAEFEGRRYERRMNVIMGAKSR